MRHTNMGDLETQRLVFFFRKKNNAFLFHHEHKTVRFLINACETTIGLSDS